MGIPLMGRSMNQEPNITSGGAWTKALRISTINSAYQDNRIESPYMPYESSVLLTQITDQLRREAGISFTTDGECKKMIH